MASWLDGVRIGDEREKKKGMEWGEVCVWGEIGDVMRMRMQSDRYEAKKYLGERR